VRNGGAERPSAGARLHVASLADRASATARPLALESAALIDYFAGNEPVAALLDAPLRSPSVPIVVSTIALAELVTRAAATGIRHRIDARRAALQGLPGLVLVDLDQEHAIETAIVRALTGLKLPDAAIVATARLAGASALLGNDRRWKTAPLGVSYHHLDDILALP